MNVLKISFLRVTFSQQSSVHTLWFISGCVFSNCSEANQREAAVYFQLIISGIERLYNLLTNGFYCQFGPKTLVPSCSASAV